MTRLLDQHVVLVVDLPVAHHALAVQWAICWLLTLFTFSIAPGARALSEAGTLTAVNQGESWPHISPLDVFFELSRCLRR
jgi:hypothetical protein